MQSGSEEGFNGRTIDFSEVSDFPISVGSVAIDI